MNPGKGQHQRNYAVIASTMRSGSTLLKALLGEAPDIAHLPEVNFQTALPSPSKRAKLERATPAPILLLKRPAWFHETKRYPQIPDAFPVIRIILLRDAYDTVRSVGRMLGGRWFDRFPGLRGQRLLAERYWAPVTRRLLAAADKDPTRSILFRYENILDNPEAETLRIFRFLGSVQSTGVRFYSTPENFRWKWGSDDGSPRIRTRQVLPARTPRPLDLERARVIEDIPEIRETRIAAGYGR